MDWKFYKWEFIFKSPTFDKKKIYIVFYLKTHTSFSDIMASPVLKRTVGVKISD